jgi:flagellin
MPVISTNQSALTSLRYVNINTSLQNNYLSQLSSGSRVQKASDDASSLAVGTKLQSDATTLAQASTSAANGQSVLSTADGGLAQISDILQRLKSLATQAQSGTNDTNSLANIDKEFQDLLSEINSVAQGTRFNGNNLLDGTSAYGTTGVDFLLGTEATDTITVKISNVTTASAGLNLTGLTVSGATLNDGLTAAASAAAAIDSAINTLSGVRAQVGADSSRLSFRKNVIDVSDENANAAASTLLDADVASVESEYTSIEVLTESGIAALQKANAIPQQLLQLLKQ